MSRFLEILMRLSRKLQGRECADIIPFVVDRFRDNPRVLFADWIEPDAAYAGSATAMKFFVATVFAFRRYTQIITAIIKAVVIYMIALFRQLQWTPNFSLKDETRKMNPFAHTFTGTFLSSSVTAMKSPIAAVSNIIISKVTKYFHRHLSYQVCLLASSREVAYRLYIR